MRLSMELFIWLGGNLTRYIDVPEDKHDMAAIALKRYAEADFAPLLVKAGMPADFLSDHIDAFVAGLEGEDRTHTYRWETPNGSADVRVLIRNESPEELARKNALLDDFFANIPPLDPGQEFEHAVRKHRDGE